MNTPTPRIPANSLPTGEPLHSALDAPEAEMNEVLLGLAWMLAGKVIRKAQTAAAA